MQSGGGPQQGGGGGHGRSTAASASASPSPSSSGVPAFDQQQQQRQCKNIVTKLQRRIDNEGHQIIPMLTELWKRIEHSSGSADNLLDLRKIHFRVEKFEYSGIVDLVSDVQLMLKCSMQYYEFTYEVRSEARKVHDLFFDILSIAFSEIDFREARSSMSFSDLGVTTPVAGSSLRYTPAGQTKRQKPLKDADSENTPFQKPPTRAPIQTVDSTNKLKSHMPQKESRLGSGMMSRDPPDGEHPPFTHPGDLVICKRKRKDREKSGGKPGNGSGGGPLSPTGQGRGIMSPGSILSGRDIGSGQQASGPHGWGGALSSQQGNSSGGSVGWANPVKRMRTDAGPSHV